MPFLGPSLVAITRSRPASSLSPCRSSSLCGENGRWNCTERGKEGSARSGNLGLKQVPDGQRALYRADRRAGTSSKGDLSARCSSIMPSCRVHAAPIATHMASLLILTSTSCLTPSSSKTANASESTVLIWLALESGGRAGA